MEVDARWPSRPTGGPCWPPSIGRRRARRRLQRVRRAQRRAAGPPRYVSRRSESVTPIFMSDGARVVTSIDGGPTVIRDARTLRPLARFAAGGDRRPSSPDDRTLLLGGRDGTVRFLDLATGRVRRASGRHVGAVVRATFGANGRIAATAGEDKRVIVWDVDAAAARRHARRPRRPDHRAGDQPRRRDALQLRPRRHGRRLGSGGRPPPRPRRSRRDPTRRHRPRDAGSDGLMFPSYDLEPGRPGPRRRARRRHRHADRRPDAAGDLDVPRAPRSADHRPGLRARAAARSSSAARTPCSPSTRATGTASRRCGGTRAQCSVPSVSADGRRMATTSRTGHRDGLDAERRPAGRPSAAVLPSGARGRVAQPRRADARRAGLPGRGIELVDAGTLRRRAVLADSEKARYFAQFTADGRHILAGGRGGWVRIWSAETGRPVGSVFAGQHRGGCCGPP